MVLGLEQHFLTGSSSSLGVYAKLLVGISALCSVISFPPAAPEVAAVLGSTSKSRWTAYPLATKVDSNTACGFPREESCCHRDPLVLPSLSVPVALVQCKDPSQRALSLTHMDFGSVADKENVNALTEQAQHLANKNVSI